MQKEIADLILCPSCGAQDFHVEITSENDKEVREGVIICRLCNAKYPVKEGIAGLLHQPSFAVEREIKAWNDMRPVSPACKADRMSSRAWIRALPLLEGKEGPPVELETWRRHGRAVFALCSEEDWRGKRVLEVGAGRCWLSAHLARQGAQVVAVDILGDDDIGLGCAQVFLDEGVFFERILCDMHHLPFRECSFDVVVATATLHHSPWPQALLEEIKRVLGPQGLLLAANEPLYVPWRETPEEERKGAHESAYPLWGWLGYLRRSGLRLKELRVGDDASLHFSASPAAAGVSVAALARGAARYLTILSLALPRFVLREARRMRAGWPPPQAPQGRTAYIKARLGLSDIAERALAEEESNWGPGWYLCEGGDEPFRWSGPRAHFLLPPASRKKTLALELATFHPSPQSDPVEVEVRVGGEKAGEILIQSHGWERFTLRTPRVGGHRPLQISLRVRKGYFKPSAMGLGEDDRLLGVACRGAWWEHSEGDGTIGGRARFTI